jgi:hypothetical protein
MHFKDFCFTWRKIAPSTKLGLGSALLDAAALLASWGCCCYSTLEQQYF